MKKILLCGAGSGFGLDLAKEFKNNKFFVILNSRKRNYSFDHNFIMDMNEIKSSDFEKYKPDVIVHLAGVLKKGSTSDSNTQLELLLDNSRINLNIFDACEKFNIKKIITCLSVTLSSTEKDIDEISIDNGPELFLNFHPYPQ